MALPSGDILKYVLGGAIGAERWTVTIWARLQGLTSAPTAAQMNTTALGFVNGFKTGVWSATSGMAGWNTSDTTLDSCHLYLYRGGVLVEQGSGFITPVVGNSSQAHPAYVALVMTLLTNSAGRSKRGRLYFPATGVPILTTTSQLDVGAHQQGVTDLVGVFLAAQALGQPAWPGTPGEAVVVLSQKLATTTDVTSVRMDSLPDTQHGRSRKLVPLAVTTHTL